ncbi:MAG: histidine kinase dimerization/phospho-acceptor domain-containing protein, partial [bacterium]
MTYYVISAFVNAFISLLLGIFVFLKNKRSRLNRSFVFWCLTVASWSTFYFIWQLETDKTLALLWTRLLMVGAIWVPIAYFKVVLVFLDIEDKKRKILYFGYLLGIIFTALLATPLMVSHVEPMMGFPFWPKPGIAYAPFLLMFMGYSAYAMYLSFRALKIEKSNIKKLQIKYMLFGIAISIAGGSTNYLLWYNIPIKPYGNIFASTYIILTTYAILKHHLLNIKIIAVEILAFFISIMLLINAMLAGNANDFILKFFIFIIGLFLSWLLIRGVLKEIKSAEKIKELAGDLAHANKKLESANKELKRLDEAKSEFLSIASHQLRTPLTAMKGLSSMLLDGDYGKISEEPKKAVSQIFESSERMNKLVNNLLDISRIESGRLKFNFEEVNFHELVKGVAEEL